MTLRSGGRHRAGGPMKKILVSECLYGGRPVRYDGGEKAETNPIFLQWKEEGRLIPVCPGYSAVFLSPGRKRSGLATGSSTLRART